MNVGLEAPAASPRSIQAEWGWGERLRSRLSRVTRGGEFIPQIDGLRAPALLAVVFCHIRDAVLSSGSRVRLGTDRLERGFAGLLDQGEFGVQLFFAISGFILALPFLRAATSGGRPVPLGDYLVRRITRLEAPYLINLFLLTLLMAARGYRAGDLLPHLGASMFYVHFPVFGDKSTINIVTWSLEVEVQFYLFMPALALAFRGGRVGRRLAIAGLALASAHYASGGPPSRLLWLGGQFHWFAVGILLADVYLTEWRGAPRTSRVWDIVGAAAWGSIPVVLTLGDRAAGQVLLPPAVFLAYAAAFRGAAWRFLWSRPWVVTLGGMCYTFYLYHLSVINFVTARRPFEGVSGQFTPSFFLNCAFLLPLIFVVCSFLFALVERPFMSYRWKPRGVRRETPGAQHSDDRLTPFGSGSGMTPDGACRS